MSKQHQAKMQNPPTDHEGRLRREEGREEEERTWKRTGREGLRWMKWTLE